MIALDSNVLVRLLVEDDPAQTARAARLLRRAKSGELFLSEVVLCETVWVLTSAYGISRADIADALSLLLRARQYSFEDPERLGRILAAYRSGRADFADCVIRERAEAAGCEAVCTFDRVLLKEGGPFRLP